MKKSTSDALFWFGMRDVEILSSRALIQRTIDVSPTFLEHGSAEKDCGLSTCKPWSKQAEGWIHFCMKSAQNFELWSNIQDQKLKIKNL